MTATTPSPLVEVRRSGRRKRTVSAHREGDTIVVLVPDSLTSAEEERWVSTLVERVIRGERRRPDDEALRTRAHRLAETYLPAAPEPSSVRWVANQRSRWGSCTPADRSIRLSDRLQGLPAYVIDYVLLHELAHLVVAGHGKRFWALLQTFPHLERARGFLEGVAAASRLPGNDDETGAAAPDCVETTPTD